MIISPIAVTMTELIIKDKKPNCPADGCHWDEKSNWVTLFTLKIGEALITKPNTINKGSNSTRKTQTDVQLLAVKSFNFLDAIISLELIQFSLNFFFRKLYVTRRGNMLLPFR